MRLNASIRLWSTREFAVSGVITLAAAFLLVTASHSSPAPFLGRWLAISIVVLWICAAFTWRRHYILKKRAAPIADCPADPRTARAPISSPNAPAPPE